MIFGPFGAFARISEEMALAALAAPAYMTGQAVEGTRFITVGAFLLGVSLVIGGFLKFYAHSKSPNDPSSSISTGFVLILCGACLVALPSLLSSGVATIFGASADVTNGTTGFIRID